MFKLTTLTLSVLVLANPLYAQQEHFTIEGKVNSLQDNDKVYLYYQFQKEDKIDSTEVKNGTFRFKGLSTFGSTGVLMQKSNVVDNTRDEIHFFMEPTNFKITSSQNISRAKIEGSLINDEFNKLNERLAVVDAKRKDWNHRYYSYIDKGNTEQSELDRFNQEYKILNEEKLRITVLFVEQNPNSFASLIGLIHNFDQLGLDKTKPLWTNISSDLKNSELGQKFGDIIKSVQNVTIGKTAPIFTQKDTLGNPVSLLDFRGKYVLIDFWASWCGPCRDENPILVTAYENYKDKNFTILGVSLDSKRTEWINAINVDKLSWPQVSDLEGWENAAGKLYAITSIPDNLLLDPEGKIIAKNLRGKELLKKLNELL